MSARVIASGNVTVPSAVTGPWMAQKAPRNPGSGGPRRYSTPHLHVALTVYATPFSTSSFPE